MKEKQSTMTGRSWRDFSVLWPFILAGLIGPPDDAEREQSSGLRRRTAVPTRASVLVAGDGTRSDAANDDDGWVCVDGDDHAVEEEPLGEMPDPEVVTSARSVAVFKDHPVHVAGLEMF